MAGSTPVYSPITGLDGFHYAVLQTDDSTGTTYDAVKPLEGAIDLKVTPSQESETLYADNGPDDTATQIGDTQVELTVKDLPMEVQAELLGQKINSEGVLEFDQNAIPPYVAFGFRGRKNNGKYRYVWLLKGRFQLPEDDLKTAEDKPDFQTSKLSGTFIRRKSDELFKYIGDEDATNFTPSVASTWFTKVYTPSSGGATA